MSPYFFRWLSFWESNRPPTQNDEEKYDNELYWYLGSIFLVCFDFLLYFYLEPRLGNLWSSIIVTVIGLVIISGHSQVYFNFISWITHQISKKDNNKDDSDKDKLKKNRPMIIIWVISVIMMLGIALFIILPIVNKVEPNNFEQIKLFLALLLVIVIGNLLFAIHIEKPEKNNLLMLCSIPFLTVLFVFLMARSTVIPKFVMSKYKFGNFETHQLLVDKNGCKILNKMKLNPDKDQEICYLVPIHKLQPLDKYIKKQYFAMIFSSSSGIIIL